MKMAALQPPTSAFATAAAAMPAALRSILVDGVDPTAVDAAALRLALQQAQWAGNGSVEVDIDIESSAVAKHILGVVKPLSQALAIDLAQPLTLATLATLCFFNGSTRRHPGARLALE